MLIAFEGGEGTGKSTQARLLADRLGAELTHEPGDTPLGAALRRLLLDGDPIDARTEALLMAADRAEHVAAGDRSGARSGSACRDRSIPLFLARVPGLRTGPRHRCRAVPVARSVTHRRPISSSCSPCPSRYARARIERGRDRIESDDDAFHERVEKGFLELAAADPDRWIVIPATGTIDEVAEQVWTAVKVRL